MDSLSTEIVGVIYQLLPGFIVAWIIFNLTAHLKPSSFERIVQALIFTVIVRALLVTFQYFLELIGDNYHAIGAWNKEVELIWSIIIAVSTGLFITWCINNDFPLFLFRRDGEERCKNGFKWVNKLLSKIKLTDKTLHPTEWFTAFNSEPRFIVLHLSGERRLYGWPKQYPDDPEKGHFIMEAAEWLLDDGSSAPLHTVDRILIQASDVEQIEFMKKGSEIEVDDKELDSVKSRLTNLYLKEKDNGNECPESTTTETDK